MAGHGTLIASTLAVGLPVLLVAAIAWTATRTPAPTRAPTRAPTSTLAPPLIQAEPCWDPDRPMSDDNPERRDAYDLSTREVGTAKRMRGKVAVVHLLLSSPSLAWTITTKANADRSALLAARFFTEHARLHGVTDLEYDPIAWLVPVNLEAPTLHVDDAARVTDARAMVRMAVTAAETSLGQTLPQITRSLEKEDGYAEVAFLLHLPIAAGAREFAYPAPYLGDTDVGIVFDAEPTHMGYTAAHEIAHLFGADDLYDLAPYDDGDAADLMRINCPLSRVSIKDMTAYAIGWKERRPERPYGYTR